MPNTSYLQYVKNNKIPHLKNTFFFHIPMFLLIIPVFELVRLYYIETYCYATVSDIFSLRRIGFYDKMWYVIPASMVVFIAISFITSFLRKFRFVQRIRNFPVFSMIFYVPYGLYQWTDDSSLAIYSCIILCSCVVYICCSLGEVSKENAEYYSKNRTYKAYKMNIEQELLKKETEARQKATVPPINHAKEFDKSTSDDGNTPPSKDASTPTPQESVTNSKNKEPKITFENIAGYETTKENMKFVVELLKNQDDYQEMGVKPPSGILMYGPPGTGKTLMAKAIAGEADVHFIHINASSFVNTFVGTGASAVRELYKTARENTPCIVFIDELDAIGTKRTGSDTHQEYKNTINALLSELDGFSSGNGILTIAATNLVETLDEALIRPGRFDRKIAIPLPSASDREKILRLCLKNRPVLDDVNVKELAIDTEGFSGASLAALIQESAVIAVQNKKKVISKADVEKALIQQITNGEEAKDHDPEVTKVVAWHEAGHALALKLLCEERVSKVTVRGSSSGYAGLTLHSMESRGLGSKKSMEQSIKSLYAGRCAEVLYFKDSSDITPGARQDISQATELIKEYGRLYGFNSSTGLIDYKVLTGSNGISSQDFASSEALSQRLYDETMLFLQEHLETLSAIADALIENITLNDDQITQIIANSKSPTPL